MFRSVLCAIDFSESSAHALRYAAEIARRASGRVVALYVNDPLLLAATAAALHDRGLATRSDAELGRFLDRTLPPRSRRGYQVKHLVSQGRPATAIAAAAKDARSDLVVLGTHGLTGADRVLIGSTTAEVLRTSARPVLAVPGTSPDTRAALRRWPGSRIVVAVDLDDESPGELATAVRLARAFHSTLMLVHVIPEVAVPSWLRPDMTAHDRIRVATAEARLGALAGRVSRQVPAVARVLFGKPADELAALAAEDRIGLMVTAIRPARSIWARRGSVSYHVLSHATVPVLALPG